MVIIIKLHQIITKVLTRKRKKAEESKIIKAMNLLKELNPKLYLNKDSTLEKRLIENLIVIVDKLKC